MDNVQLHMHSSKFPIENNGSRDYLMTSSNLSSIGQDNPCMEDPYTVYRGSVGGSGTHGQRPGVIMPSAGQNPHDVSSSTESGELRDTCHRMFQRDGWGRGSQSLPTNTPRVLSEHQGKIYAAEPQIEKQKNGTLTKKYHHIKDMLSNKFNRSDHLKNSSQRNNGTAAAAFTSRQNGVNSSFRRAILKSAEKSNLNGNNSFNMQSVQDDVVVPPSVQYGYTGSYLPPPSGPPPPAPVSADNTPFSPQPPCYSSPPPVCGSSVYGSVVQRMSAASRPQQHCIYQQLPLHSQQQQHNKTAHFNGQSREDIYVSRSAGAMVPAQQAVKNHLAINNDNAIAAGNVSSDKPNNCSKNADKVYMSRQDIQTSRHPVFCRNGAVAAGQFDSPGRSNQTAAAGHLDVSVDSAVAQTTAHTGHSSGNDSEWVDVVDSELREILEPAQNDMTANTPPLPALSLNASPACSNSASPKLSGKYALSYSASALNQPPDLIDTMPARQNSGIVSTAPISTAPASNAVFSAASSLGRGWNAPGLKSPQIKTTVARGPIHSPSKRDLYNNRLSCSAGAVKSPGDSADIESVLDQTTDITSDDDDDDDIDRESTVLDATPDGPAIRKQLESLEKMYSEVLRLLGGPNRSVFASRAPPARAAVLSRHRVYGSMSSLPSSVAVRPDKRREERKKLRETKVVNKRFQRLESHVVTLARSVAHLSSEIRTQHVMFQELDSIKAEVNQLRAGMVWGSTRDQKSSPSNDWEAFRGGLPSLTHPGRVRKLTKFFGDEPPLLRIFLKKLGYEKFATVFEREKIGMIELPYMSEERLQKLGIPVGPRLRILQEAQMSLRNDNLNVYIL